MLLLKPAAAALLLIAAAGLALHGQPSAQERLARLDPVLEAKLAAEEARLDPGELYDLTRNNQVRLVLLDLRAEADYNQFHLTDAVRQTLGDLEQPWLKRLPSEAVVVVMSDPEALAEQGWKLLTAQGVAHAYILGGGVDFWLDVYMDGRYDAPLPPRTLGPGSPQRRFSMALGADHPAAHPDPLHTPQRAYTPKVKSATAAKRPGGGCG